MYRYSLTILTTKNKYSTYGDCGGTATPSEPLQTVGVYSTSITVDGSDYAGDLALKHNLRNLRSALG